MTTELRSKHPEVAGPTTIRILLYTDDPNAITEGEEILGLGPMKRHLLAQLPAFANVSVEWKSRFSQNGKPENKLDVLLKNPDKPYDEVWFFGTYQATRKKFISGGVVRGGPESELLKTEVEVLREWMSVDQQPHMKGGGLLMTGDHNQTLVQGTFPTGENPLCPESALKPKFFGLGRAIGRCVPRAGRLRQWEGKPTNDPPHNLNTQVPSMDFDIESQIFQLDATPQRLLLTTFDRNGEPDLNGLIHPLFFYRPGRRIQFLPDHAHEGAIILPTEVELLDHKEWPSSSSTGVQPQPRIVARGLDNRTCSIVNLVAAYNGDCARVGRIVADSTWHHYVGVNLTSFPHPAQPDTPAHQIGQFYRNLALWLAPRQKRFEMACAMFRWLANHPLMIEEIDGEPVNIGRAAYAILIQVSSPCEISEVLDATVPTPLRERYEAIYFPDTELVLSPFPSMVLLLGCIVNSFQKDEINKANSTKRAAQAGDTELIAAGFKDALVQHARHLEEIASEASGIATPASSPLPHFNNQER